MANRMKGEAEFKVGDKSYILCFNHGALIEMEDQLDMGFGAIAQEMQSWQGDPTRIRLKWIRALLYVGLKKHHPRMILEDVNDIMFQAGRGPQIMEAIGDAMSAAFGTDEDKPAEGEPRPTSGDSLNGTGQELSQSTSPTVTS